MGKVKRSPWLLHYDGSSCNGCDIEVLAALTPVYDAERFGVINTGDPMQADIFLITGGINSQNASVVRQLYDQMPRPKVVVAVGTCACTGGIFKECYNIRGGADTVIPVDIYVPGCAARPQSIIDGIIQAVGLFQKKSDEHDSYEKARKAGRLTEWEAAHAEEKAEVEGSLVLESPISGKAEERIVPTEALEKRAAMNEAAKKAKEELKAEAEKSAKSVVSSKDIQSLDAEKRRQQQYERGTSFPEHQEDEKGEQK